MPKTSTSTSVDLASFLSAHEQELHTTSCFQRFCCLFFIQQPFRHKMLFYFKKFLKKILLEWLSGGCARHLAPISVSPQRGSAVKVSLQCHYSVFRSPLQVATHNSVSLSLCDTDAHSDVGAADVGVTSGFCGFLLQWFWSQSATLLHFTSPPGHCSSDCPLFHCDRHQKAAHLLF